ncbi:MAG: hypothetical protein ACRDOY_14150, partial [Nocardioidaceae bacterium]
MMQHGRHAKLTPHHPSAIVAIAVLLISLAVVIVLDRDPTKTSHQGESLTGQQVGTPSPVASRQGPTALAECRASVASLDHPLSAAQRSLDQWRGHVDAMNLLVAGKVTLNQASNFWARTREQAAKRVAEFEQSDAGNSEAVRRCVDAPGAPAPAEASTQLAACLDALHAHDDAIDSARVAIGTWKNHIQDMEALRAGQLSPNKATTLWLRNWRQGVEELDRHAEDRRT